MDFRCAGAACCEHPESSRRVRGQARPIARGSRRAADICKIYSCIHLFSAAHTSCVRIRTYLVPGTLLACQRVPTHARVVPRVRGHSIALRGGEYGQRAST